MNLLVTGGAGFIGSNFVRYMLNKYPEYKIVNYDLLTYAGNLENLKDIQENPRYVFVRGDIRNYQLVDYIVKSHHIDVIVNFAAESHVDRSISDPSVFVKTNVLGTQVLLDVAKANSIQKYVQISTDEVYGSLGDTGYFTEETPLAPNSPYSASKASADLLVRAYHETYGLNVNITRCSNNYGPYHFPEKLIPLIITNALEGKELPIYGDGQHIRDWLYVKDHCAAIDLVIHKGKPGEVYNIGGHNERTNNEIVHLIVEKLGVSKSLIKYVSDRPGHDRRYAIDPTKIMTELGWKPQYTFDKGIEETIQWYINNKDWWKRIKSGEYMAYYQKQYGERE
ncbi:dTDP-glucose 4,6-dehydratase [Geobacillus stearothermophilus]|uniref:dTDP-glucose 4,6-dehydratase n=1 Tax=Geobacillus stearothermophilus TaxID=1422 RepID=Q6WNH1_GEOSE|nr:dTDP-glucose 4,6-dehydratase [Geobacillus stearothermophilus]AAQ23687.1 dTDP-glucose 4,6-dehydratase [Geobacillus stearothermophilus ATCC 12980]KOR93077.1 spore coat protein [Geobacillus stearothermophilus ATCC 12980]MED5012362.1 dTDP-glucose 4,6-dehydratase [Geobacillus stearothermophilus]MED5013374.1 dTDP-glucose 4,6-dehydratase [Geobacillus stearothermophilus]MED5043535.1 dTDP-glucose 4,6-dehydratase [Geobacillus stearothermophilus]